MHDNDQTDDADIAISVPSSSEFLNAMSTVRNYVMPCPNSEQSIDSINKLDQFYFQSSYKQTKISDFLTS